MVRLLIAPGVTKNAINWLISPHAISGFKSDPVVQISQIGYHSDQQKVAVVELDNRERTFLPIELLCISEH